MIKTGCIKEIKKHRNPILICRYGGSECEEKRQFAPSYGLLKDAKSYKIGWREYTERYRKEMNELFGKNPDLFFGLIRRAENEDITLICHEPDGMNCHRHLLKGLLERIKEMYYEHIF